MKVVIGLEGKPTRVEVDLAAGTARVGEHVYPVKVVAESPTKVEVEVAGERVVVEGWYPGVVSPSDPVNVNGERFRVSSEVEAGEASAPVSPPPGPSGPSASAPLARPAGTKGTPVAPPMPGKVVELRVANGDRVRTGQVLLVLEAMKMRNEIPSPVDGVVADLSVSAGANVRARETMLVIAPE